MVILPRLLLVHYKRKKERKTDTQTDRNIISVSFITYPSPHLPEHTITNNISQKKKREKNNYLILLDQLYIFQTHFQERGILVVRESPF